MGKLKSFWQCLFFNCMIIHFSLLWSRRWENHYDQNWVWKKSKPADMRPWSTNYVVFCGPETVILKILTLAKGFLQTD